MDSTLGLSCCAFTFLRSAFCWRRLLVYCFTMMTLNCLFDASIYWDMPDHFPGYYPLLFPKCLRGVSLIQGNVAIIWRFWVSLLQEWRIRFSFKAHCLASIERTPKSMVLAPKSDFAAFICKPFHCMCILFRSYLSLARWSSKVLVDMVANRLGCLNSFHFINEPLSFLLERRPVLWQFP